MVGSRMFIYKQDPSVQEPGMRSTFIPSKVLKGPKDKLVRIADVPDIDPDENGDFLIWLKGENRIGLGGGRLHFDAVHSFAVCRQVLTMYERAFNRLDILRAEDKNSKGLFAFKKKWKKPLDLYVRAKEGTLSAQYTSGVQTIFFGYKDDVFTCRSFDVIAHETGHAVLDAIRSGYKTKRNLDTLAIEEAFCDLTAVFTLLSQMDMCESIIALSKGDLRSPTEDLFISCIAEEYGMEKYKRFALRDISQKYIYSEMRDGRECNQHDLSLVFSSAVYSFLTEVFEDHICPDRYDPAETLFWLGRMVTEVTIGAFYNSKENPRYDFKSVGLEMVRLLRELEYKEYHECLNKSRRWEIRLLEIFREHEVF